MTEKSKVLKFIKSIKHRLGFHQYKPFDCGSWEWAKKDYRPIPNWPMRFRCQNCIDNKNWFIDIKNPQEKHIKIYNQLAKWSDVSSIYIKKIPK